MPDTSHDYKYTNDIKGYQDSVWDFLMEHCEVLDSGALFFKFHADNRRNFENRVLSRWKHNYHREDPKAKYAEATQKRLVFEAKKAEKDKKWEAEHERRKQLRKALARVKRHNTIKRFIAKILTWSIHHNSK